MQTTIVSKTKWTFNLKIYIYNLIERRGEHRAQQDGLKFKISFSNKILMKRVCNTQAVAITAVMKVKKCDELIIALIELSHTDIWLYKYQTVKVHTGRGWEGEEALVNTEMVKRINKPLWKHSR